MPRRSSTRKTGRPKSVLGQIMSPVNVTNKATTDSAMKRIRSCPLTVVLIYANWCGHCHSYMPFFDNMARTSGRTANMVKIEESALPNFNDKLVANFPNSRPLKAEGYPTLLAVSKNGSVISQLPIVREEEANTKMIRSVGNIAASIPKPEKTANIVTKNTTPANISSETPKQSPDLLIDSPIQVVNPPSTESDISPAVSREDVLTKSLIQNLPEPTPRLVGGNGLYGTLLDATYQLAPAAVLTGIATGLPRLMRKTRHSTSGGGGPRRKSTCKNRRNRRRNRGI